jgi:hypothetical protein
MNRKIKLVLFAALCLFSAAVFARTIISDGETKKAASQASTLNEGDASQRQRSGLENTKGGGASGGTASQNKNGSGNNTGSNQPAADNSNNNGDNITDPGSDGIVGQNTGSVMYAGLTGCDAKLDSFINTNKSALGMSKNAGLTTSSCDFNRTCENHVKIDSKRIWNPGSPQVILKMEYANAKYKDSGFYWDLGLSAAWYAIAQKLPRQVYNDKDGNNANYVYTCIYGEQGMIAGDSCQPFHKWTNVTTWFSSKAAAQSHGRVYIIRCCANKTCREKGLGQWYNFSTGACQNAKPDYTATTN